MPTHFEDGKQACQCLWTFMGTTMSPTGETHLPNFQPPTGGHPYPLSASSENLLIPLDDMITQLNPRQHDLPQLENKIAYFFNSIFHTYRLFFTLSPDWWGWV